MPTLANQTVKKYDGVTDIIWTGIQSGGSRERPAIWTSSSVGAAEAHRPEFRFWIDRKLNAPRYIVNVSMHYPSLSLNSTTGITSVIGKNRFVGAWDLDTNLVQADRNELIAQGINLLDNVDIVNAIRLGQVFT